MLLVDLGAWFSPRLRVQGQGKRMRSTRSTCRRRKPGEGAPRQVAIDGKAVRRSFDIPM
jgi:hypothetical protein